MHSVRSVLNVQRITFGTSTQHKCLFLPYTRSSLVYLGYNGSCIIRPVQCIAMTNKKRMTHPAAYSSFSLQYRPWPHGGAVRLKSSESKHFLFVAEEAFQFSVTAPIRRQTLFPLLSVHFAERCPGPTCTTNHTERQRWTSVREQEKKKKKDFHAVNKATKSKQKHIHDPVVGGRPRRISTNGDEPHRDVT